jgi:hypothetical protein
LKSAKKLNRNKTRHAKKLKRNKTRHGKKTDHKSKTQYKPLINWFGKKKNLFLAVRTVVGGEHGGWW